MQLNLQLVVCSVSVSGYGSIAADFSIVDLEGSCPLLRRHGFLYQEQIPFVDV